MEFSFLLNTIVPEIMEASVKELHLMTENSSVMFDARSEPHILRKRVEQALRLRWGGILACAAKQAFAASLLDLWLAGCVDGDVPASHEVVNELRHAGLEA